MVLIETQFREFKHNREHVESTTSYLRLKETLGAAIAIISISLSFTGLVCSNTIWTSFSEPFSIEGKIL